MNHSSHTHIFKRFIPLVALAALVLLFFNKLAFSNLILARGDMFLYFYPYWQAAMAALRDGRIPLWNPNIFMGAPLLANSQVGFFYPLNWPFWLLLETPYAVSASIILHIGIAAVGAYLAGRRIMRVSVIGGLVTAVTFALGGYLTAQVEHINQLQGLAWLPWFLVVIGTPTKSGWRGVIGQSTAVALLFALQLLAGHTQTTFITGIAIGIWLLTQLFAKRFLRSLESNLAQTTTEQGHNRYKGYNGKAVGTFKAGLWQFVPLILGAVFALLLAAVQLLPTLELTSLSSRQGGLAVNEVLSFSLHPLLLTRSFLPTYNQSLFSEYVAILPLILLALAFIAAWQWRVHATVFSALVWVLMGILLAFGLFNPLYWLLARLPAFNLFRVPARWLILYALGTALLAGVGWDLIRAQCVAWQRPLRWFLIIVIAIMAWGFISGSMVGVLPTGPEAPFEAPHVVTIIGWMLELGILLGVFFLCRRGVAKRPLQLILGTTILISLFAATRTHPYNNPTTPEAYFDLRPPITRLLIDSNTPPGRFLSLSDTFFDPGDQAEINSIYAGQLSAQALYDYTVAIKQKEIISPNLPLVYGLNAVDGFDGGILPLRAYSELMRLVLPAGTTTDGRLREQLTAVPPSRWLDLFNAAYLITDKTGDVWVDGIFFDRQHPVTMQPGDTIEVGTIPNFEATEIHVLATAQPEPVTVQSIEGTSYNINLEFIQDGLYRAELPTPTTLTAIKLKACERVAACEIQALTLVDSRADAFQSIVPGSYRLIHSGDVKIYANLDVQPRAFWLSDWQWQPDSAAAVEAMQTDEFDPRKTAVLIPNPSAQQPVPTSQTTSSATVNIRTYTPENVIVQTQSDTAGLLVLTDAFYPGWQTAVDGEPVPLYQANGMFRAVFVPAGEHQVVFSYESKGMENGRIISLAALLLLLLSLGFLRLKSR